MSAKHIFSVAFAAANLYYASSFSPLSSFTPLSSVQPSPLHTPCHLPRSRQPFGIYASSTNNDDLIKSLLSNDAADDTDPHSRFTHQIAIPLQDASELHSALHSIQTSLVRDCPRLIRACVMPALLRMPLLYVDGSSLENSNVVGGNANLDVILEEVVQRAIREVVYGEDGDQSRISSSGYSSSVVSMDVAEPILLHFRGLELQGEDNSVLYAVGNDVNDKSDEKKNQLYDVEDEDDGVVVVDEWSAAITSESKGPSGWEMLEKLVKNIQDELENSYGLDTCWPLDKPQGEEIEYGDPMVAAIKQKQRRWRPRVPFVRLPKDFYQDLQNDLDKRNENKKSGDDNDEDEASVIDMGFDGISPLFWYEAWGEEDIIAHPGVRMQSVAVYRRMVPGGGEAESSFYVPTSSDGPQSWKTGANAASGTTANVDDRKSENAMELPVGDAELAARERREKAKAMDRLGEVEQRAEREWEEGKARWMEELSDQNDNDEGKLVDSFAQFDVGMEMGEVTVEGDAAYSIPWSERGVDDSVKQTEEQLPDETSFSEDTLSSVDKEHSKSDSLETPALLDTKPRKELPSIEDNPVFQRLWKGQSQKTLQGQNSAMALDGTPPAEESPLPPYPSDAHFTGAWRVVSSPLGSETPSIDDIESKSSDNFILRVDGQVMGGPILDAQYQQKAAGGEWKMFQAIRKTTKQDDTSLDPPVTQTRLRIRLLVPPGKDRALVMEGEVTRLVMPGAGDATSSPSDGWMMASGGMLDGMLQNLDDVEAKPGADGEGLLYCGGEAWMEDVDGGGNRRKVGPFSLHKLPKIDRKNLIYTVDIARPNPSDEENEEDAE
ncbi:hypothetical protein ACHAXR_004170 [Thalassiosira sp. AJA248-18]